MNEEKEKFTQGPWNLGIPFCHKGSSSEWCNIYADSESNHIAEVLVYDGTEKNYYNAHLIAAAPEMYELLKQIRDVFEANCCIPCSQCHKLQGEIEAIIEKVRGEE